MLCSGGRAFPAAPSLPGEAFSFLFCALQINCVTFPHPDTMPEQQLLKPTEWSYCDYFWVSVPQFPPLCDSTIPSPDPGGHPEGA